jgi:cephalosporin hydroxylase
VVVRLSSKLVNIKNKINKAKFILKNYGFKVLLFHSLNYIFSKVGNYNLHYYLSKYLGINAIKLSKTIVDYINNFKQDLDKVFENEDFKKKILNELNNFCTDDIDTISDFVTNSNSFCSSLINAFQCKEEFAELLKIYKELNPKVVLEIGSYRGGTLFSFIKLAPNDSIFISIDLPFWGIENYDKIQKYEGYINILFNSFLKENQKLYLIRDSSILKKTFNKVKEILDNKTIDFLFIDGDHSYKAVKSDFENYSKFVRKGGIVAFHDINLIKDVKRFWNEVKNKGKSYRELIKDSNSLGIGVLYL